MIKKKSKIPCHHCNSDKYKYILHKDEHNYFYCLHCGLIFSDNLLIDKVDSIYKYKQESDKELEERFALKNEISKRRLQYLTAYITLSCDKVLDIGCGEGSFLYALKEMGVANVLGIDPNILQTEYGINKFGLNIVRTYYSKESFPAASFDLVTLNRTLEHMPNPYEIISWVKYHLKDNGYVMIDVPTYWDKNRNFWDYHWGGGHLRLYDINTLVDFLMRNNFEVISTLPYAEFNKWRPGCACLAKKTNTVCQGIVFPLKDEKELRKKLFCIKISILKYRTLGRVEITMKKILKAVLPQCVAELLRKLKS